MSANPFLSIIIPVYNAEQYLSVCIDSILQQEFTDYEIILVDDGSTDRSGKICDSYVTNYKHIRVLHQKNSGHTAARQAGFRASTGTYIAFADSDDWVAPTMYTDMCRAAADSDADIIHCDFIAAMPDGNKKCGIPFPAGYYDKTRLLETVYPRMIYSGTFFVFGAAPNLWNKLFKRPLLEQYLFRIPPAIKVGEDGLITYSCLLAADSVYFIGDALYYYRSNSASLCHNIDFGRLRENHLLFDTYSELIDTERYPVLTNQLSYFIAYQSLLTLTLVFQETLRSRNASTHSLRRQFMEECDFPAIRAAFSQIKISQINGIRNKIYSFAVRHRLYFLFRCFLR